MRTLQRSLLLAISIALLHSVAAADEKCVEKTEGRRNRLFDQDFGLALTPDDFLTSMFSPFSLRSGLSPWIMRDYFRPWRQLSALAKDYGSSIKSEKDKFQINLDVQHFSPDEITVKTADGYVVIEGKHEEKEDEHGYVARHFSRRYALPEGTTPESVVSSLSSDGVLTVTAPRKDAVKSNERLVPITQTGPVRREAKQESIDGSCDAETCVSTDG